MKLPINSAILLGLLLGCSVETPWASPYPRPQILCETAELAKLLGDPKLRILDARPPESFQRGHIPGAVNFPVGVTDDQDANRFGFPIPLDWARRLFRGAGINADSQIVVYDEVGRYATRVFYFFEYHGHQHVRILHGGIAKWQEEGRPVTQETASITPGDFDPRPQPQLGATSNYILQQLRNNQVVLLDARSEEEFRQARIPGAVNLEWSRLMATSGVNKYNTFLSPDDLSAIFQRNGLSPDKEVITSCRVGNRSSVLYFALRLMGFPRVRLYDGSMEDWLRNPNLPVEKE